MRGVSMLMRPRGPGRTETPLAPQHISVSLFVSLRAFRALFSAELISNLAVMARAS